MVWLETNSGDRTGYFIREKLLKSEKLWRQSLTSAHQLPYCLLIKVTFILYRNIIFILSCTTTTGVGLVTNVYRTDLAECQNNYVMIRQLY